MADPSFTNTLQTLEELSITLGKVAKSADIASVYAKKLQDMFARQMDLDSNYKALQRQLGILKKTFNDTHPSVVAVTKQMGVLNGQMVDGQNKMMRMAGALASIKDAHKNLEKAAKGNVSTYDKFTKSITSSYSAMSKWLPLFGGQTVTLNKAKTALVKYNQSMFDLQRVYQVAGTGSQAFETTLRKIGQTTTMSQNQFLDFAKVVNKSWVGIAPGISAVGDLASAFQHQLGPELGKTQEALNSTLNLMQKFPALAKANLAAMKQLASGEAGGEDAAKKQRALTGLFASTGRISSDALKMQSQMLSKVTGEQEKQIDTNRKLAGVSQKFEDTMLNLGKQAEPAIKGIAISLNSVMSVLQKMPMQIMAVTASFKAMQLMMPGGGIGGGLMGMMGGMGKGSMARGAIAKSLMAMPKAARGPALKALQGAGLTQAVPKIGAGAAAKMGASGGALAGVFAGVMTGMGEYGERTGQGEGKGTAIAAGTTKGGVTAGGAIGGAAAGAAIGSVVPVIGTAIGGIVGGIAGAFGGQHLGEKITDKLWPEVDKAKEEQKKLEEQTKKSAEAFNKEYQESQKISLAIMEAKLNQDLLYESAMKTHDALREEINILGKFGLLDFSKATDKMFEKSIKQLENARDAAEDYFKLIASDKGMMGQLQELGIELSPELKQIMAEGANMDANVFVKSENFDKLETTLQEQLNGFKLELPKLKLKLASTTDAAERQKIEEQIEMTQVRQQGLQVAMEELGNKRTTQLKMHAQIAQEIADSWNKQAADTRAGNTVFEKRLDIERQLMESAQFGMGASLEMMQRQVDMAYELMNVESKRLAKSDQIVASKLKETHLSEQQQKALMGQLKAAKTQMQVQNIIHSYGIKREDIEESLSLYAQDQQDANSKIMEQQKKIYDITKDVREGYLDAMQEMAVGFGEFEKIIGTQEMGASQLMGAVDKYNVGGEQGLLNTMAIGGAQSQAATRQGVGTEYMGRYGATPGMPTLGFQQGGTYNRGLQRYAGYDKSMQKYYADQRGQGGRSMVGGASAMTEQYEGAIREGAQSYAEQMSGEGFDSAHYKKEEDSTYNALSRYFGIGGGKGFNGGSNMDIMGGIPDFWKPGGMGPPGAALEKQNINSGWAYGSWVAGNAQGSSRADPSPFTRTRGPMGVIQPYGVPTSVYGTNPGYPTGSRSGGGPDYWSRSDQIMTTANMHDESLGRGMSIRGYSDKEILKVLKDIYRSDQSVEKILKKNNISDAASRVAIRRHATATRPLQKEQERIEEATKPIRDYMEARANLDSNAMSSSASGTTFYNQNVPLLLKGLMGGSLGAITSKAGLNPAQKNEMIGSDKVKVSEAVVANYEKERKAADRVADAQMRLTRMKKAQIGHEASIKYSGKGSDWRLYASGQGFAGQTREGQDAAQAELTTSRVYAEGIEKAEKALEDAKKAQSSGAVTDAGKNMAKASGELDTASAEMNKAFEDVKSARAAVEKVGKFPLTAAGKKELNDLEVDRLKKEEAFTKSQENFVEKSFAKKKAEETLRTKSEIAERDELLDRKSMTHDEVRLMGLTEGRGFEMLSKGRDAARQVNREIEDETFSALVEGGMSESDARKKISLAKEAGRAEIGGDDTAMLNLESKFSEEGMGKHLRARLMGFGKDYARRDSAIEDIDKELGGIGSRKEAEINKMKKHYTSIGWGEVSAQSQAEENYQANQLEEEKEKQRKGIQDKQNAIITKELEAKEEANLAQTLRQSVGEMKGKSAEEIAGAITSQYVSGGEAGWEKYSPKDRKKIEERIKKASEMGFKDSSVSKEAYQGMASQAFGQGYTSQAEKEGLSASGEMQARFNSNMMQQQMADTYGESGEGGINTGGAGGIVGAVKVLVTLSPDLQGQIESMGSVVGELERGAAK
ncbi:MAG: hypothetical protein WC119_01770 [Synergistaceae bacterium]